MIKNNFNFLKFPQDGVICLSYTDAIFYESIENMDSFWLHSEKSFIPSNTCECLMKIALVAFEETDDLIELTNILVHLEDQLSDLFKVTFESEIRQLKSPDRIMENLVDEVMSGMSEEVWMNLEIHSFFFFHYYFYF